ncbi:hypothetical protein [Kitasatospora sp. NPDC094016]|uniref:hypothetical protein n=1 Tax=Kitasatospora sp. NPDC094016 TaxID=3154986 RepID=UPI00331F7C80
MTATRLARSPDGFGDDLAERIALAVTEGDGATLDVLLAVLEAVADEPVPAGRPPRCSTRRHRPGHRRPPPAIGRALALQ